MKAIKPVLLSGREVLPIIEGGKGIGATNGQSSGAFAAGNAIGTFSGVNADYIDEDGQVIPVIYNGKTRRERHEELVNFSVRGGVSQARIAHDISGGLGRIHMNILWEMGGAQRVLQGILEGAKGLIHGITCGAGMPYKLSEFAARFGVHYYPIVSSLRAFRALWLRAYSKTSDLLGGVVYEDPWRAGGHNGLSNKEDPLMPEDPYPRVLEIRKFMNQVGLHNTPIIMAGGVWYLKEWDKWLDNPEIGPVAFQFGTRPLLTKESPISNDWKDKLLTLKKGEVYLNKFSPTGFYSSAVENDFIRDLIGRQERQVEYRTEASQEFPAALPLGARGRPVYLHEDDLPKVQGWISQGFAEGMKTPDSTLIFVTPESAGEILNDQRDCMGCLSMCRFSNWSEHDGTGQPEKPDPRSFCIQKTLQKIIHEGDVDNQLMFAGHNAYRFADDPFYKDGFVPTVKQLIDRILTGE